MSRPKRSRRICCEPKFAEFSPNGIEQAKTVCLSVDEFEVIRIIDFEKQTHEQCSKRMAISRTTVTEIYQDARQKLADCIVNGSRLIISGGHYRICDGSAAPYCGGKCSKQSKLLSTE
ncbi:MAG: DUF134 domain-containing protein [Clostridiales bacterium]|nr:DUF134 domain-containing protein [Clostridiales bacterium]